MDSLTIKTEGYILGENPHLAVQISPPGYPPVGESWTISVYLVNVTSAIPKYKPALNSTVVVTLLLNGRVHTYELPVDENGRTSFEFLPGCSDIAFQAHLPGLSPSAKVVLSEHYISPHVVDSLLLFNLPISIFSSLGGGWLIHKKGIGKFASWTLFTIICMFCFVAFFSTYSKLFQYTTWGYPENIWDGVTFSLLRNVWYVGIVCFVSFVLVSYLYGCLKEYKIKKQKQ